MAKQIVITINNDSSLAIKGPMQDEIGKKMCIRVLCKVIDTITANLKDESIIQVPDSPGKGGL